MKKIFAFFTLLLTAGMVVNIGATAYASALSNVTPSLSNPVINQPYFARIKFFFDGSVGPNIIVSNLPPGVGVVNPTTGYTNAIYGLNQRDANGYYYIDLSGTPSQTGTYNVQFYFFDTTHTFDTYQNYSLTVQQSTMATTASFITGSLAIGTINQAYASRVEVSSDGGFSPNFIVTYLPPGIYVANTTTGYQNAIYGTALKDVNGYYYIDLAGTPTQAGNFQVSIETFNTTHTFDVTKNYSLAVRANGDQPYPPCSNCSPVGPAHTPGTNVLGQDGTVYRLYGEILYRYPYTSAGAFLSYGFNSWANVVPATSGDMALPVSTYTPSGSTLPTTYYIPPRNGSLINDKGTIYLISNGLRTGFSSANVFLDLGYSFANVQSGDTSFMVTLAPINSSEMAHPDGTLVNDHGTIYLMRNGIRMGFPSLAVFKSWGLKTKEAVPANNYDRAVSVSGTVTTRLDSQLSI